MAKKKKTQLKPVARGFATVSVAKKVDPVEAAPEDETPLSQVGATSAAQASEDVAQSATVAVDDDNSDAARAEELFLQTFVDKFQDRVEKEVIRTVKAIEQEQRFSATLPRIDLDPLFVESVLQLAAGGTGKLPQDATSSLDGPEEKMIPQLAITYGVLRRLGLDEETVEKCLKSMQGIDLDEAAEWLCLHCSEDTLRTIWGREDASSKQLKSQKAGGAYSSPPPASPTRSTASRHTPYTSPPMTPRTALSFSGASTPSAASSTTLVEHTSDNLSEKSFPGTPDEDPNLAYVRLKMRISELTTHRAKSETADDLFLRSLQKRLEAVQQDYLFDKREAETAFHAERKKADALALQSRLRGEKAPSIPATPTIKSPPRVRSPDPHDQSSKTEDVFDQESDEEESGGLFEILEMPQTDTTSEGTLVQVRDMPAPKGWSGKTPRTLLVELVTRTDRFANVSFTSISGASRAKRAAVRIIWQHGNSSEWSMMDVACHDANQAEQYIATVALHGLAFPPHEGFAVGGAAAANTLTSYRLLPPIHRDLWNDLEEKRRANHDQINRDIWAKLRQILEPKLSGAKTPVKRSKGSTPALLTTPGNEVEYDTPTSADIANAFHARQASIAYQEMLQQRNNLPIAAYREHIISTLESSQVLVLSGETGCGKSTQLPAFILEDYLSRGQHCKIYCTEPRRISAISLATRVSRELGEAPGAVGTNGSLVGYSIRLESNTSKTTRLAYVTNGIALRMLEGSIAEQRGSSFDEITHIIVDEVHERTIESDFLLIVLKSLIKQRPNLRVVLMSATLDADKFSSYFDGCPVLQVPGRTFPVDVRYLEDAVELTKWKVTTGSPYAMRGNDKYSRGRNKNDGLEDLLLEEEDITHETVQLEKRYSSSTAATINLLDERLVPYDLIIMLLESICAPNALYGEYSSAILVFMPGLGEIRRLHEILMDHKLFSSEDLFKIYPLHSTIASDQQAAVFNIPPPGIRKIVIATNIAETGITIPDITCVIDTGRQREMRFDEKRQISRLVDTFVAKSNAAQRRGRAGRVQPGLCFHLFTKSRHDTKMTDHPDPEIMRLSLSDLALRIKIMKLMTGSTIEDVLSRALDPPSPVNIQRAVSALVEVGALTTSQDITSMGRLLSKLPTDVHLGKFLLISCVFGCLDPALTIAAALNSKSPFLTPFGKEQDAHRQKLSFRIENSDFLTLHSAFSSWRRACGNGLPVARKLCREAFLSHQNLQQIEELRQQFLGYLIDSSFIKTDSSFIRELNRARYSSRGRIRFVTPPTELDRNSGNYAVISAALTAGLFPKVLSIEAKLGAEKLVTITNNQAVAFHPSSVNARRKASEFGVHYLNYFTIMQSKKMYAWETGPVDDLSLVLLCGDAEFKLLADSIFVDRKVRFSVGPKASVALKYLRKQLATTLSTHFSGKPVSGPDAVWEDTAMAILGKVKPKDEEKKPETLKLVVNRVLP